MNRLDELEILIPKVAEDIKSIKVWDDGSSIDKITASLEILRKLNIEKHKINFPNQPIPIYLIKT